MFSGTKNANLFIKSILHLKKTHSEISEIILFGSYARKNPSPISDVDILILTETTDKKVINNLVGKLRFLERKFFPSNNNFNIFDWFLDYFNIATGMFRSWFVCSKEEFNNQNFSGMINNIFPGVAKIFIPSQKIFSNIKKDGIVLSGDPNLLESLRVNESAIEIYRSVLLNLFLSLGGIFLVPFTRKSIYYSLEAVKWSLFTLDYLNDIKTFENNSFFDFKQYRRLRNSGEFNLYFCLNAPILVLKIHKFALSKFKSIKN